MAYPNYIQQQNGTVYQGMNATDNNLIKNGMSYNPFQQGTVAQQPQWLSNFQQWMKQFGGNR